MNRRQYLRTLSPLVGAPIAGCLDVLGSNRDYRLAAVELANFAKESVTYHLRIEHDRETIVDGTRELAPRYSPDGKDYWYVTDVGNHPVTEYTVFLQINDGERREVRPDTVRGDGDVECVELNIDAAPGYVGGIYYEVPCDW
ncbi:hypothetical protein [Halomarina pelagica]|uniref:hypothetical protein n=1 Tax=Halomarina pelagica TaxID=2961599 RepID=UPI0020C4454E|nr:hypothetical protein [Halomarina sp. BND7]